jgi:hypothetical protein
LKVIIYDKNPGKRKLDKFLALCWLVGCFLLKYLKKTDDYYGATDWEDALKWLRTRSEKYSEIQYWGHGFANGVLLAGQTLNERKLVLSLRHKVTPETLIWFRICSYFQGHNGQNKSEYLANELNCTIAGHTRIIGVLQGGLHTRKPMTSPSWSATEGELPRNFFSGLGLVKSNNSIWFWETKIPNGW